MALGLNLKEHPMRTFTLFLKLVSPVFFLVGALHLALGVQADVLLGARLAADVVADPALDSQNRFYGVAFTLYGVLLWLGATDLKRYAPVLRCVIWVFFAAGMARFVAMAQHGVPPPLVIALWVGEVLPPPLLIWWLSQVERQG
jgi:hypothetical protein